MSNTKENDYKIFYLLKNNLKSVYIRWIFYRDLYDKSEDTIKLLNETAPTFFSVIQRVLIDEIIISICRLTDRKHTGKNKNIVLECLLDKVDHSSDLVKAIGVCVDEINELVKPLRNYRNKKIAHIDMEVEMATNKIPFEGIDIETIEKILRKCADLLNEYEHVVMKNDGITLYEGITILSGPRKVISALKNSLEYKKLRANTKTLREK